MTSKTTPSSAQVSGRRKKESDQIAANVSKLLKDDICKGKASGNLSETEQMYMALGKSVMAYMADSGRHSNATTTPKNSKKRKPNSMLKVPETQKMDSNMEQFIKCFLKQEQTSRQNSSSLFEFDGRNIEEQDRIMTQPSPPGHTATQSLRLSLTTVDTTETSKKASSVSKFQGQQPKKKFSTLKLVKTELKEDENEESYALSGWEPESPGASEKSDEGSLRLKIPKSQFYKNQNQVETSLSSVKPTATKKTLKNLKPKKPQLGKKSPRKQKPQPKILLNDQALKNPVKTQIVEPFKQKGVKTKDVKDVDSKITKQLFRYHEPTISYGKKIKASDHIKKYQTYQTKTYRKEPQMDTNFEKAPVKAEAPVISATRQALNYKIKKSMDFNFKPFGSYKTPKASNSFIDEKSKTVHQTFRRHGSLKPRDRIPELFQLGMGIEEAPKRPRLKGKVRNNSVQIVTMKDILNHQDNGQLSGNKDQILNIQKDTLNNSPSNHKKSTSVSYIDQGLEHFKLREGVEMNELFQNGMGVEEAPKRPRLKAQVRNNSLPFKTMRDIVNHQDNSILKLFKSKDRTFKMSNPTHVDSEVFLKGRNSMPNLNFKSQSIKVAAHQDFSLFDPHTKALEYQINLHRNSFHTDIPNMRSLMPHTNEWGTRRN